LSFKNPKKTFDSGFRTMRAKMVSEAMGAGENDARAQAA
jgi:hypothetical protein